MMVICWLFIPVVPTRPSDRKSISKLQVSQALVFRTALLLLVSFSMYIGESCQPFWPRRLIPNPAAAVLLVQRGTCLQNLAPDNPGGQGSLLKAPKLVSKDQSAYLEL